MKKLITIFLSTIVCLSLWGQQKVPMTIVGDVYIANSGIMKSEGTVHLKADTLPGSNPKVAKVANYGRLDMDTIIFYSNTLTDGLLMNQNSTTPNGSVTAKAVVVRKMFKKSNSWNTMSLPFDIDMGSHSSTGNNGANVRYSLNGRSLVRGTEFEVNFYDVQARADDGRLFDNSNQPISYWKMLGAGTSTLNKATGYQVVVKFSLVDPGKYPSSGNTLPIEIDFLTSNVTQIADLLDKKRKGINLTFAAHTTPGPYAPAEYEKAEGWNTIGGLNPTLFELKTSPQTPTVSFTRAYNYWDESTKKWAQYTPIVPSATATLSPYAVFFVQSDPSKLTYNVNDGSNSGGILYLENGTVLSPNTVNFRSVQETYPDVLGLHFAKANKSSDNLSTYFSFSSNFQKAYSNSEDDIHMSPQTQEVAVWSLAKSKTGDVSNALFVNRLPYGENETNLGFCAPDAGEYTFSLTEDYNQTISKAILWDKLTNTTTDLLTNDYTFQTEVVSATSSQNRFVLFFNKTFTAIDELQTSEIYAYADNNVLTVKNLVSGDKVQIVDVAGRTIASGIASGNEFFVTLNQKGVYIVNVKGKKIVKVLNK